MATTKLLGCTAMDKPKLRTPPKRRRKRTTKGAALDSGKLQESPHSAQQADEPVATATLARQVDVTTIEQPATTANQTKPKSRRARRSRGRRGTSKGTEESAFVEKTETHQKPAPRRIGQSTNKRPPATHTARDVSSTTQVPDPSSSNKGEEVISSPKKAKPGRKKGGRTTSKTAPSDAKSPDKKVRKPRATQSRTSASSAKPTTPSDLDSPQMLINVSGTDECRIAVVAQGRLEELFIERSATLSHVGNIYKGRVTNLEPSIQAAFVDFGLAQNGFLHISDVQPQYFPDHSGEPEEVGRKIPRHARPPIQNCFRRGQEVIVQVTKEGVGTKGPTLSSYLSIPGRFLVMMPGMHRHGVSRKIEDDEARRRMRDALSELNLPSDMGFILRTAGLDRSKRELQRDLTYLTRLWKTVVERVKKLNTPAELYQESDLVTRTIRDIYTTDFKGLIVDDADTAQKVRDFLQIAMPRRKPSVELYSDREPLFHRYRIEEQIERINMRQVPLPSGGSLVIDSTEALVAIDVNSGRSRVNDDAEETAFATNIEAAEEIARQLRLRDLGGLIVCDFIDMRLDKHKREVERTLKEGLRKHKERARILKMSAFGLIEMTRQRQGPSMKRNIFFDCPSCKGTGLIKMPDSVILDVMRIIQLATNHAQVQNVTVTVASNVAIEILNTKRATLARIEAETQKEVVVRGESNFVGDHVECLCKDSRGRVVRVPSVPPPSGSAL